ncbi:MAG: hypothetical protein U0132_02000 [Gemmatimonadaceae bacterium]
MWSFAAVTLVALSAVGCSATLPVRTLPAHESRWTLTVGGPVVPQHVATTIIPYVTAGAMYGMTDATTLSGSAHLLTAAMGVAGVDGGVAHRLSTQDGVRPEFTGQAQLYVFHGSGSTRAFPGVTGTASWRLGMRTLGYVGSNLTTQFSGEERLIVSPSAGIQRDVGRRFILQLETRWMAANIDTHSGLMEGESSISGHGGVALLLGVQVRR